MWQVQYLIVPQKMPSHRLLNVALEILMQLILNLQCNLLMILSLINQIAFVIVNEEHCLTNGNIVVVFYWVRLFKD
jgi:hypothetical protein